MTKNGKFMENFSFWDTGDNAHTFNKVKINYRNFKQPTKCNGGSQEWALQFLLSGDNIFLTGGAGTRKSFVLRKFVNLSRGRNILLTAPTVVAANNIHGATLHRTFKLQTGIVAHYIDEEGGYEKYQYMRNLLNHMYILISDEISMCRVDIFAYIADLILEQYASNHYIQVVLRGDFFQLPPVIGSSEREAFMTMFPGNENGWCFLANQWKDLNLKVCNLVSVIRQADYDF